MKCIDSILPVYNFLLCALYAFLAISCDYTIWRVVVPYYIMLVSGAIKLINIIAYVAPNMPWSMRHVAFMISVLHHIVGSTAGILLLAFYTTFATTARVILCGESIGIALLIIVIILKK